GLEFAYTQAPLRMKGTIMSLWLLTTFAGNFVVVLVKKLGLVHGTVEFLFWAGLTYLAAVVFALIARRYVVRDHYLPATAATASGAPMAQPTTRLA
ncbi:MAG: MFS transporter, partial [Myxococcaceae bacterium]